MLCRQPRFCLSLHGAVPWGKRSGWQAAPPASITRACPPLLPRWWHVLDRVCAGWLVCPPIPGAKRQEGRGKSESWRCTAYTCNDFKALLRTNEYFISYQHIKINDFQQNWVSYDTPICFIGLVYPDVPPVHSRNIQATYIPVDIQLQPHIPGLESYQRKRVNTW